MNKNVCLNTAINAHSFVFYFRLSKLWGKWWHSTQKIFGLMAPSVFISCLYFIPSFFLWFIIFHPLSADRKNHLMVKAIAAYQHVASNCFHSLQFINPLLIIFFLSLNSKMIFSFSSLFFIPFSLTILSFTISKSGRSFDSCAIYEKEYAELKCPDVFVR